MLKTNKQNHPSLAVADCPIDLLLVLKSNNKTKAVPIIICVSLTVVADRRVDLLLV